MTTATTQYRDGNYKLLQFDLTFPNGRTLTLTPYCARADIYESVLEPTVIAEFVFTDKTGIFDAVNFLEEKITIHFTTYEDNEEAGVKYELYPIILGDPADSLPDDKGIVYKVTCVSQESIRSTQIKNLSFTRQKIESEKMIVAFLQDSQGLNSKKNVFLEKTRGLHAFNFTLVNPFTAIDEIRLKALSSEFNSHCFVFYENSKGYHFKSFEGLVKDGKTKIGDKYYTQSAAADVSIGGAKWRNILAFKVVQSGNQNITRAIGAGNVTVRLQNQITRKLSDPINIDQRYLNFVQLNDNAQSASLTSQNEISSTESRVQVVPFDPTIQTEDIAEIAVVRPYYLAFLFNTIAHITVYGDTTVTIGDVITAKIPEMNALTLGEERPYVDTSSTAAGNYLVTKCRHTLTFSENSLSYLQALEIVKDGYGGNQPKTGNFMAG
jgi:hypothetical protein